MSHNSLELGVERVKIKQVVLVLGLNLGYVFNDVFKTIYRNWVLLQMLNSFTF